jgi:hypothetical protein
MKKIIAIAFIGMFGVLTLGSCKKDYTCDCTITTIPGFPASNTSTTINGKKKEVKDACEKNNNANVNCKIK